MSSKGRELLLDYIAAQEQNMKDIQHNVNEEQFQKSKALTVAAMQALADYILELEANQK